jgi:hypothetical protein
MTIGYTPQQTPPPKVPLTGLVVGRALEELLIWLVLFSVALGAVVLFNKLRKLARRKTSDSTHEAGA